MPAPGEVEGQRHGQDMNLLLLLLLLVLATTAETARGQKHTTEAGLQSRYAKTSVTNVDGEEDVFSATMPDSSGIGDIALNVTSEYGQVWTSSRFFDHSTTKRIRRLGEAHQVTLPAVTVGPSQPSEELEDGTPVDIAMVAVPVLLVLLIVLVVIMAVVSMRRKRKASSLHDTNEDENLAGHTDKVPMPMFEDDVPSVLELEMEDLEKWMAKDSVQNSQDSTKEN